MEPVTPEMNETDEKLLNDIADSADTAKIIKKEDPSKRHPKSDIPLKFDIPDPDDTSLKVNLIKYINSKSYTYQDLFDYCITHLCNGDEEAGKRIAYRIISGLKSMRDIRVSTLDMICDFLDTDIILEERKKVL